MFNASDYSNVLFTLLLRGGARYSKNVTRAAMGKNNSFDITVDTLETFATDLLKRGLCVLLDKLVPADKLCLPSEQDFRLKCGKQWGK